MNSQNLCLSFLKQVVPFSGFTQSELENVSTEFIIKDFDANTVVLGQGTTDCSHLYLILSGQVRIVEAMTQGSTYFIGEGKLFGYLGLLRDGELPFQAQAYDKIKLALLPANAFEKLYQRHPRFAAFFESEVRVYTRTKLTLHDTSGSQLLFGTRLADMLYRKPPQCEPDCSIQQAATIMNQSSSDCLVVMKNSIPIGIITDSLLRSQALAKGLPSNSSVSTLMNNQMVFMTKRNSLFEALLMMSKKGISHILVLDEKTQKLSGVIGNSDITRVQGYNPLLVLDQIDHCESVDQLAQMRREADLLLVQLFNRGVKAQNLITINTLINDSLTAKVLALSRTALADHYPQTKFNWVWLSLGSEGRGEMSFKTDQDNALIYDVADNDIESVQHWFSIWTDLVNNSLDKIGLKLCSGNMMASNPQWRIRIQDWQDCMDGWLKQSKAMQIMQISAACDLRAIHGDVAMEGQVKNGLKSAIKSNPRFLKHMVAAVLANRPPLNQFTGRIRTLKTQHGQKINLKRSGIQPITEFARILSLQAGFVESSNTFDRLEYLKQTQPNLSEAISNALEAYGHLNEIRLGQHMQSIIKGDAPDNWIGVNELNETQYLMLKAAFSSIKIIQVSLAHRFNLMGRF